MAKSRFFEEATVVSRRDLTAGYFVLSLAAPQIAAAAEPGQFVMCAVRRAGDPGTDPLLPRPFTFLKVEAGVLDLLVRSTGRGTSLLSQRTPGEHLSLLGPLGRGFRLPADPAAQAVFVAGGVGVAPFLHLASRFAKRPRPVLLYGGRTAAELPLLEELAAAMEVKVATQDGTLGEKGLVTALLPRELARLGRVEVYACGPEPMLAAVVAIAREVPVQASLEARMACGLGVCRGCAVPLPGGGYLEACVDGPVCDGHRLWG